MDKAVSRGLFVFYVNAEVFLRQELKIWWTCLRQLEGGSSYFHHLLHRVLVLLSCVLLALNSSVACDAALSPMLASNPSIVGKRTLQAAEKDS